MKVLRPTVVLVTIVALGLVVALLGTRQASFAPSTPDSGDSAGPAVAGEQAAVIIDAQAGAWYCPAEDGAVAEDDAAVVAVRPAVDSQPARFTTRGIGSTGVTQIGEVFPGAGQQVVGGDDGVEVRWTDRPVTVSRLGVVPEDPESDEPAGVLARPCISRVATEWTLPGMSTAAGATVTLRVTNPLAQEAAVSVQGLTPQGPESPIVLQNISVPAGETVEVDINEYLPQQPDLALHVVARSGRIVVDALLESRPTVSGVAGRTPLDATAQAGTRWFLPWVGTAGRVDGRGSGPVGDQPGAVDATATPTDGPSATPPPSGEPEPTETPDATETPEPADTSEPTEAATPSEDATDAVDDILDVVVEGDAEPSSWLWLANPDEEEAANVQVSWLTSQGRVPATILGSIEVGAGSVRRLALDDVLPDAPGDIGVDLQVTNDVPIAVASGTIVDDGPDARRTGVAVIGGVASDDDVVSVTSVSQRNREQWLTLANPFGVRSVVDLRVWNGSTSQAPEALRGLELGPGETLSLDLSEWATGSREFTVFAAASEGSVTAVLRGVAPGGPLRYSATAGVPLAIWTADGSLVSVVSEPGLVNRLGTDLGLPLEVATPTPTPEPVAPDEAATPSRGATDPATSSPDSSTTTAVPADPATSPTASPTDPAPSPTGDATTTSSPASPVPTGTESVAP